MDAWSVDNEGVYSQFQVYVVWLNMPIKQNGKSLGESNKRNSSKFGWKHGAIVMRVWLYIQYFLSQDSNA
jgi:hypothetical protein